MAQTFPATVILDGKRLAETKQKLILGDENLVKALGLLTVQADTWLNRGPWTVTSKKVSAPSGNKHDYASQAPYWWPSPIGDGSPYIQRDGERNPECKNYTDKEEGQLMFESSYVLALAWYYSGNEVYAKHAGDILRTWFISSETRMNPNLNHAQIIPGSNTGRPIGIIDFSQGYTNVLDAVAILEGAPGWVSQDADAFRDWNREFLTWLDGDFGIRESAHHNNHGTFALMLRAAVALFVGETAKAKKLVLSLQSCIDRQIAADGSQPLELERTRSWHYSVFNLIALVRGASIGSKIDVDLWAYKSTEGASINGAVDFIFPYATGESGVQWMYPEFKFDNFSANDVIQTAAAAGNSKAKAAISKLPAQPGGDLWNLVPGVQHVGSGK